MTTPTQRLKASVDYLSSSLDVKKSDKDGMKQIRSIAKHLQDIFKGPAKAKRAPSTGNKFYGMYCSAKRALGGHDYTKSDYDEEKDAAALAHMEEQWELNFSTGTGKKRVVKGFTLPDTVPASAGGGLKVKWDQHLTDFEGKTFKTFAEYAQSDIKEEFIPMKDGEEQPSKIRTKPGMTMAFILKACSNIPLLPEEEVEEEKQEEEEEE